MRYAIQASTARSRNAGRFGPLTSRPPLPPPVPAEVAAPEIVPGVIAGPAEPTPGGLAFPVRPPTGPIIVYVLPGDHPPHILRRGDLVRVVPGQASADGTIRAHTVEMLATLNGPVLRSLS